MYEFTLMEQREHDSQDYFVPGDLVQLDFSDRFSQVHGLLLDSFARKFPDKNLRLGISYCHSNGATGVWATGWTNNEPDWASFNIDIEARLVESSWFEAMIAHELAHAVIKLNGVPTPIALSGRGTDDQTLADELASTVQHVQVFDWLRTAGYEKEQEEMYIQSAVDALERLRSVDYSTNTYRHPPGTIYLALWYFNFYQLCRDAYDEIAAVHRANAPPVSRMMKLTVKIWNAANNEKRNDAYGRIKLFQRTLHQRMEMAQHIRLEPYQKWKTWLFP